MTTYRLDTINFKDGELRVKAIPNAEPLEFVVSGKSAEQFFDALKANGYKTDKLCISACSKRNGDEADEISINVPIDSGCGTEPGDWIECEFESEPDKQGPSIVRRIQMGEYNGKPLYWIYLGHYDEKTDLFLSEDIICKRRFDTSSNYWFSSELAKWLSCEFVKEAFLPSEYHQLVPLERTDVPLERTDKGMFGYKLFLLSGAEYIEYQNEIPNVDYWWWLRTQGFSTDYAEYVYGCGSIYQSGCRVDFDECGVRPAFRLRRS
jgi:hypothetical protein